jgi:hypothetical protein
MTERIDEQVGVMALYYPNRRNPLPYRIKWKDRYYTIKDVDFRHPVWEGRTLHHIFSVCDGTNYFRLNFNTRSMQWILEEISDGLPS